MRDDLVGAKELFQDAGDDPEMKEMAREEMKEIEPQMEALEAKIQILLLPKDPNDDRNCMLEIRAGTGGSEANIFAGDLVDVYRKYMTGLGYQVSTLDSSPGDDGGYKAITLDGKFDHLSKLNQAKNSFLTYIFQRSGHLFDSRKQQFAKKI